MESTCESCRNHFSRSPGTLFQRCWLLSPMKTRCRESGTCDACVCCLCGTFQRLKLDKDKALDSRLQWLEPAQTNHFIFDQMLYELGDAASKNCCGAFWVGTFEDCFRACRCLRVLLLVSCTLLRLPAEIS